MGGWSDVESGWSQPGVTVPPFVSWCGLYTASAPWGPAVEGEKEIGSLTRLQCDIELNPHTLPPGSLHVKGRRGRGQRVCNGQRVARVWQQWCPCRGGLMRRPCLGFAYLMLPATRQCGP